MSELERILRRHAALHPRMRPCDAVKLVYQNEFGGGHVVTDSAGSLERLRAEYAAVGALSAFKALEPIGNGVVRVMLAGLDTSSYSLETLNADFVRSAAAHTGTLPAFLEKLTVLRALSAEGIFDFSPEFLDEYLIEYARDGYPPVSHSPEYRAAYQPAYRVVLERFLPPAYQQKIGAFWND